MTLIIQFLRGPVKPGAGTPEAFGRHRDLWVTAGPGRTLAARASPVLVSVKRVRGAFATRPKRNNRSHPGQRRVALNLRP
jgi:hypothetical protein